MPKINHIDVISHGGVEAVKREVLMMAAEIVKAVADGVIALPETSGKVKPDGEKWDLWLAVVSGEAVITSEGLIGRAPDRTFEVMATVELEDREMYLLAYSLNSLLREADLAE